MQADKSDDERMPPLDDGSGDDEDDGESDQHRSKSMGRSGRRGPRPTCT